MTEYIHVYTCTYIHVYTCIHVHTCTCMYTCTYMHVYMYIHTCIHVHTCMYTCTYIHEYTHVHTLSWWDQTSQWSLDSGCFELVSSHQQGIHITFLAHPRQDIHKVNQNACSMTTLCIGQICYKVICSPSS